ncbi:biofilm regulation protein kinase SiaB [Marinomonas sp. A79]|uniref:Biofilm regulation protein kinase SiaB n=1 Tax=Marinomonas vulgaris TaxID=2823372 RepID=A0ABS5H835_9GAMM|nr:biofilm regulation protein kinase SiaB [Marinomonas vulgaris]MBR7887725.1 biofilm regulation protein kinase SiaB [Marinomonas vulgaris]
MSSPDLYGLRERFETDNILLCFNGPISRSLIEEIGNALKNYLKSEQLSPASALDVFAAYIELTQNIRHYATTSQLPGADTATVIVSHSEDCYRVAAGNIVKLDDGHALVARIEAFAKMDKVELKAAYKTQLRQPRDENAVTGAGLGLIDMARKSSKPMQSTLRDIGDGTAYFSLSIQI